jgi:O-antigen/teichoic acid export membrane protein
MRLGSQAAVLMVSRLANFALMLLSPVVLVRLMSVEEFGHYREFMLYAALLQNFAALSIPESLLYFIPVHPQSPWRVVRHTVTLTAITSLSVVTVLICADLLMNGALVGQFLLPLALYALFLVNIDFWEVFLIATRRAKYVVLYTAVRLTSRMLVAVIAAVLTRNVQVIIWSLITLEGVRFVAAFITWRVLDKSRTEPPIERGLRRQIRYCLPMGASMLLALSRRNLATIAVVKMLGQEALARYSIGKYAEPIVATVRNSLSSVILPEMVRRQGQASEAALLLWRRSTVICTLIMFPIVPLVVRFAEPLVVVVFGEPYRAAAIVTQLYMLVVVRECFDFSPALRAQGRTSPIVYGTMAGLVVAACAVWLLVTRAGIAGAMGAFAIGSYAEACWLAASVMSTYRIGIGGIADWRSIGKVVASAALASLIIVPAFWTEVLGLVGVLLAALCYAGAYALLVWLMKIPETKLLMDWAMRFRRARA